jgi:hypothetical protein
VTQQTVVPVTVEKAHSRQWLRQLRPKPGAVGEREGAAMVGVDLGEKGEG